ncbi:MAG TPA: MMPL family transporter [Dehalococcoidia bacterium]|nr:MMPL family transporter [Dehalococcoidia bacterium]
MSLQALARFCYRRRRYIVGFWILLLVGVFALNTAFAGEFKTEFRLPGSESQEAVDLLEQTGGTERTGEQGQVVFEAENGIDDPEVQETMEAFFADIEEQVEGVEVVSPYEEGNQYLVGEGGEIAYAEINFGDRDFEAYTDDADEIKAMRDEIDVEGLRVELGGFIFSEPPTFSSEFIGIAAAIIILLVAFGSIIAMGLPIITALFGIGCAAAIIGLLTLIIEMPEFTSQVAAMIGIGVGIDYALLVVTRYRSALHDGLSPEQAVVLSLDTSGRAVIFAGLTVVFALLGMFMMNLEFVRGVSIAAILAVLLTAAAAITMLPALLGFAGRNIDKLGLPHRAEREGDAERSFWYRWSRVIQAHPWPALIVSAGILIVMTIPLFSIRLGFGDTGNLPEDDTARQAYDLVAEGFGPGRNSPLLVVAESEAGAPDEAELQALASELEATEGIAAVTQPVPVGDNVALISVYSEFDPQDAETDDMVHRVRGETVPAVEDSTSLNVLTTGGPGFLVDFADYTSDRLPFFIAMVLALSFLLLLFVFHSVVVPLKAVIMNLLSIGAAFGLMVAVFQWGWGLELIGVGREGPIEAWAPMMLFAIVFGLSMDYEVFLLTRIREEYDRTGDNRRAVADGLAATGRVITAAALIMVCVFGSFVLGELRDLKIMGFGLAAAVFIDATIVRMALVPSFMELMGNANWWAPEWLVRYLPHIKVDPLEQPAGGGGGGAR